MNDASREWNLYVSVTSGFRHCCCSDPAEVNAYWTDPDPSRPFPSSPSNSTVLYIRISDEVGSKVRYKDNEEALDPTMPQVCAAAANSNVLPCAVPAMLEFNQYEGSLLLLLCCKRWTSPSISRSSLLSP